MPTSCLVCPIEGIFEIWHLTDLLSLTLVEVIRSITPATLITLECSSTPVLFWTLQVPGTCTPSILWMPKLRFKDLIFKSVLEAYRQSGQCQSTRRRDDEACLLATSRQAKMSARQPLYSNVQTFSTGTRVLYLWYSEEDFVSANYLRYIVLEYLLTMIKGLCLWYVSKDSGRGNLTPQQGLHCLGCTSWWEGLQAAKKVVIRRFG